MKRCSIEARSIQPLSGPAGPRRPGIAVNLRRKAGRLSAAGVSFHPMHLAAVDVLIIAIYGTFVLAIGVVLRRRIVNSADFFLAGRSIPAWVAGLAFLSANLGAQEVIGMAASGAKYGI